MPPNLPHTFYRISIKGLILDPSRAKFLITQEANGLWELPGGGMDWGETPQEALAREIREEMGLEVTQVAAAPSYFLVGQNLKGVWSANIVYEATLDHLDFTPSDECVALKFASPDEVLAMENAFRNVKELAEMFDASKYIG